MQEFVVLAEIQIAVHCGTVDLDLLVESAGPLPLGDGLGEHAAKSIRVAKFPMGFSIVGVGLQRCSQEGNGLLNSTGIGHQVAHVNARLRHRGAERDGAFKCVLGFLIEIAGATVKGGLGLLRAAQGRPCGRVVGLDGRGLFEHCDCGGEVVHRIEIDPAKIVLIGLGVDRSV